MFDVNIHTGSSLAINVTEINKLSNSFGYSSSSSSSFSSNSSSKSSTSGVQSINLINSSSGKITSSSLSLSELRGASNSSGNFIYN